VLACDRVQPLAGFLVVELAHYLPGPYAGRELLRLGARVVRVEPPRGDPLRRAASGWHEALNAGKESVVCDLKSDLVFAQALCERADVVLDGFRPGALERAGLQPPERVVWCSITGFGAQGPHALRAGHDLNYLGYAGVLADTAPGLPPVPIADLAAGALAATCEVLAALLDRARGGRPGRRLVISMTHGAHRLASHRLSGEPLPRLLTGGLACYRMYATADGRFLTVAALEEKFFRRLCQILGLPHLASRQYDPASQEEIGEALSRALATRSLDEWLQLFDGEDVCVGPVWTLEEAAEELGSPATGRAPALGEHTDAWRRELGL